MPARSSLFPFRLPTPALAVIFLLTPVTVVSLALATCRGTLFGCGPTLSDEICYWLEIATFERVGFRGGYFVPDEQPAPCPLTHFGAHGPAFPVVYGSLARVLGWKEWSGPIFNILFISAGAGIWLWLCRPDRQRLAAATFLMATYWPCLLFIPCTLQEGLHTATAFLLAGLAHSRVNGESRGRLWPFFTAVVLASLVRVTWVIVLIPWAGTALRKETWKKRLLVGVAVGLAIPGLIVLWRYLCAPFPNFLAKVIAHSRESPAGAASELTDWIVSNLRTFASFSHWSTLESVEHFELLGMVLIGTILLVRPGSEDRRPYLFATLNLALIMAAVVILYELTDWRSYRVIAPHLLLPMLVFASGPAYRWSLYLAAVNLAFAVAFVNQFQESHARRLLLNTTVAHMRARAERFIRYNEMGSPWGNTLLASERDFSIPTLLAVPPGIGVSFALDQGELRLPLKSRYVTKSALRGISFPNDRVHLRLLADDILGRVYLNLDCDTEETTSGPRAPP